MKLTKDNYFVEVADFKLDRIAEFKKQGWIEEGSEPVPTEVIKVEIPMTAKTTAPNKRGPKPVSNK